MHQEFPKPCEKHNSELFGREFGNDTANKIKTKQETKEILTDFARPFLFCTITSAFTTVVWY